MGDFDIDVEDSGAVEVDGDEEEQKQWLLYSLQFNQLQV